MKKILGIILVLILTVILVQQVKAAEAQLADEPITGPITSPITGPITSVTPSTTPTPTLIQTISTTPTVTPTPTPVNISNYTRLGGLNLDGYCSAIGKSWDTVINGVWYCGNGSEIINMTAACQWQYGTSNAVAVQDVASDVYSWSCYAPSISVTPTLSPTETPAVTPSTTPTETPSVTPSTTSTPSILLTNTPTPTQTSIQRYIKRNTFSVSFFHFPAGFPFAFVNAARFFNISHFFVQQSHAQIITAQACTTHDQK